MKKGFFAYSSEPEYCGEFIEEALVAINKSETATLSSWKDLNINGKLIIYPILKAIDRCDFLCADLTGMNDNVLFEIGFAIAKRKPIWLILDTSHIDSVKRFKELNFLTTIGYSSYNSSSEIENNFYRDKVHNTKTDLIESLFSNISSDRDEKALFYIKGQIDTNYSQEILNIITSKKLPCIVDDPVESKIHPLSWYIEQLYSVPAFLGEFSSIYRTGFELHNSKCALVSGMALGLGLEVMMVAEKPYPTPMDYRELLSKYTNRESCKSVVEPFLERVHQEIAQLLLKKREEADKNRQRSKLQRVHFGEFIAEHESENLYNYFVETSHYQNLIKSEHNIVIGRKGTGKTATLYFLEQELNEDTRNHICLIKPINFEVDGLIELFKNLNDEFEKGYITESIWKFLIYTEIAKSLYLRIKDQPLYSITNEESKFILFIESKKSVILSDFSTRLEQELELLKATANLESQQQFRIKIAEILHDGDILSLKEHIKIVLNKRNRLIVLIDNLDKSWRTNSDIHVLSKFILGLLGTVGRIAREFRGKPQEKLRFTFHLTLFLRSDIFKYIMSNAREPDKIEYSRLRWNDPEILFRVLEQRFLELTDFTVVKENLWEDYVVKTVSGMEIKSWVISKVIPRPRDIIYFFNIAKNFAVSRGHTKILEKDLVSAYEDYSNWIFKSILVENGITVKQMETFMYNLMGESVFIKYEQIRAFMEKSEIDISDVPKFIDHLVSLSILGRETKPNNFEYEFEFDSDIKIKVLSEKLNTKRYKIHEAFVPYLESTYM
ncbi:MAG: hypothetical protein WC615_11815 [Mucilaginibacter sp.]|jgi:hypothetical protein|uniref:P-loop ATPase, Sll1717 family n=1 Tax=Mucilaginibacter sp. TaxID=1882438 RepID=UPI003564C8D5